MVVVRAGAGRWQVCVGIAGVMVCLLSPALEAAEPQVCRPTPMQTQGPYYPAELEAVTPGGPSQDLSRVQPEGPQAEGLLIYLFGRVLDTQCRAVAEAVVEVWQASSNGRYAHPRDRRNPSPLDPAFRYWAKASTDREGRFQIKTIKPGPYAAGRGWTRPSHLHVKVHRPGYLDLTTQLYFVGDPHQDRDHIFQAIPPGEQSRVLAPLEPSAPGMEPQAKLVHVEVVVRARAESRP